MGEYDIQEGFAGQVLNRVDGSRELLRTKAGLAAGEFLLQGALAGDPNWRPRYSLLFAGIPGTGFSGLRGEAMPYLMK